MTDLPAAIARLTADDDKAYFKTIETKYPAWRGLRPAEMEKMVFSLKNEDRCDVLEALLDARPITAEGLVEAGAKWNEDWLDNDSTFCRWLEFVVDDRVVLSVEGLDQPGRAIWYIGRPGDGNGTVNPPPQTMGDVATLLLRLARGME